WSSRRNRSRNAARTAWNGGRCPWNIPASTWVALAGIASPTGSQRVSARWELRDVPGVLLLVRQQVGQRVEAGVVPGRHVDAVVLEELDGLRDERRRQRLPHAVRVDHLAVAVPHDLVVQLL